MSLIPPRSISIRVANQHEEDVYYVRVFPGGRGSYADTYTNCYHSNADSLPLLPHRLQHATATARPPLHRHQQLLYSQTHTDTKISANAEAATHAPAES